MSKWHLIIDVARCENCNNCVLAHKDELVGNDFPGYSAAHPLHGAGALRIERRVRGEGHLVDVAYLPTMCNHCDDAPCVAAGNGAVKQRADGIVLFDPVRAKGRRDLVEACPYGSVVWNEEAQLPQTWFFDAHLLDQGWKAPRCVQSCPTDAIEAVKLPDAEMAQRAARDGLAVLRPALGTRPRVYYRHLHRFQSCFIGGTVLVRHGGTVDVVVGARVHLQREEHVLRTLETDLFGDFKFDAIEPHSGPYRVVVESLCGAAQVNARVDHESVVLPDIVLDAHS
jgi:Fe-S-cluster-containing dehydrogenase component